MFGGTYPTERRIAQSDIVVITPNDVILCVHDRREDEARGEIHYVTFLSFSVGVISNGYQMPESYLEEVV